MSESTESKGAALRDVWMEAAKRLEDAGVEDARFEAEVLLRHAAAKSRAELYANLTESLDSGALRDFEATLARRIQREPLAYITGNREFYKLDFEVTPDVLVPRPESELLVEAALDHLRRLRVRRAAVVDVGTGSGAIGIAIVKNRRDARLVGIDVSREALLVARRNAQRLIPRRPGDWIQGDLLTPINGPVDCVVANLPYVPEGRLAELEPEVAEHEPRQALTHGTTGTELILRLLTQLGSRLAPQGVALIELDSGQEDTVSAALQRMLPMAVIEVLDDLSGQPRVVKAVNG